MRVQYVMVFFILTEARRTKKKKLEPEAPAEDIAVPPSERYYRVPFGTITLEGFNPLAKGPLEYENFDLSFIKLLTSSTDTPDIVPFVPNNEDNIKFNKRKWKRSKTNKKKRDHSSKTFGMNPNRAYDSPQTGDDLPEGPDDNDKTQTKQQYSNMNRAGMYLDFTRNFMSSIGQRYREGKPFAHGSLPDKAIPEPTTEIPKHIVVDKYYPERKIPGYPKYPFNSYIPPFTRNALLEDKSLNWTTCEEFGRDAVFYPNDIVNIEWVPFFVWTDAEAMIDSIVHTFEYPTIKLVQKYKKMASPLLKKKLDWEAPKLLMKLKILDSNNDMLIIAADRKGKFDGLRYMVVPEGVKELTNAMPYPVMSLHLKSLGSYLAMMSCIDKYALIMAPSGTEPKTFDAARRGAAFLKFNGTGYVVERNLLKEKMIKQTQMDIEARVKADDEGSEFIPPGPTEAFFPFNKEMLDML